MILLLTIATSVSIAASTLTDEMDAASPAPVEHLGLTDRQDDRLVPLRHGQPYFRISSGFVNGRDSDGPGNHDIDFDTGVLISLGLGKRVMTFDHGFDLCAEFDAVITEQDADTHGPVKAVKDLGVGALLFDGIANYHFEFDPRLSLYGGFGIGVAAVDVDTRDSAGHDFDVEDGPFFAWQGKTGVIWRFAPRIAAHAGLRVLHVEDVNVDDDIGSSDFDLEIRQAALEAGLMFDI